MSELAVKLYVQQQLALLDVPVDARVFSHRPKEVEVGEQAVVVITIRRSREKRFTLSRPAGSKRVDHDVCLYLYMLHDDEQAGGRMFDGLKWQIGRQFRAATIPVSISDPDNGEQSGIMFVGEDIDTRTEEPQVEAELGTTIFYAEMTLAVAEIVTG